MKFVLRILAFLPVLLASPANHANNSVRLPRGPALILWAWEHPEFLDFINPQKTSIAFLDQTLYVRDQVTVVPRLQPLRIPSGTNLISVVRIEMPGGRASPSEAVKEKIIAALLHSANRNQISALQIDFDAVQSQRNFYRDVLMKLRRQMPPTMPLSITALASWCAGDDWISDLPVDEAVPMFFRMGRDRGLFNSSSIIREPRCLGSLGVSNDEPWPLDHSRKRLYVFNPRQWTPTAVANISARVTE
jgi:hypothetical protein